MQGFPLVSLITFINVRIYPPTDKNQDGVRVRRYNLYFETDPAFNFEMDDQVQTDGRGRHVSM